MKNLKVTLKDNSLATAIIEVIRPSVKQMAESYGKRLASTAEGAAKALAPVRTGALRKSIVAVLRQEPKGFTVTLLHRAGLASKGKPGPEVYGPYVERGTRKTKAQPHLQPGLAIALRKVPVGKK